MSEPRLSKRREIEIGDLLLNYYNKQKLDLEKAIRDTDHLMKVVCPAIGIAQTEMRMFLKQY